MSAIFYLDLIYLILDFIFDLFVHLTGYAVAMEISNVLSKQNSGEISCNINLQIDIYITT